MYFLLHGYVTNELPRNELERVFLELIQFNINVQQSAYAKYYFDLRSIAEQHGLTLPIDTLDKKRAKKLEVCTHVLSP